MSEKKVFIVSLVNQSIPNKWEVNIVYNNGDIVIICLSSVNNILEIILYFYKNRLNETFANVTNLTFFLALHFFLQNFALDIISCFYENRLKETFVNFTNLTFFFALNFFVQNFALDRNLCFIFWWQIVPETLFWNEQLWHKREFLSWKK